MYVTVNHFCRIANNCIFKDGIQLFSAPELSFPQFSEAVYRQFQVNYPKFHKMDNLGKLGFLASDILLNDNNIDQFATSEKTGVILSNSSSSLDTDLRYAAMVKSGVASPAVFVYSLPNIVIGEICIRNGIKGENTFFISDRYDIPAQVNYINYLFETGVIEACICGWLELIGADYEAFLYVTVKGHPGDNQSEHTPEIIKKLYEQA